mgnify:CR=1 FL=1
MFGILKKTCGVCLIGLGLGILLVTGWLFLIGSAILILGLVWLAC